MIGLIKSFPSHHQADRWALNQSLSNPTDDTRGVYGEPDGRGGGGYCNAGHSYYVWGKNSLSEYAVTSRAFQEPDKTGGWECLGYWQDGRYIER